MSTAHVYTSITPGDDPPPVRTYPVAYPARPAAYAIIDLGAATIHINSEDQAYALIVALREAARFLEGADPGGLQTTTEAEADFQAAQARAELAVSA